MFVTSSVKINLQTIALKRYVLTEEITVIIDD